jgi:isopenicillin N synthase-like dioxygenase
MDIPVIDIRALPDDAAALALLDTACREWGFFQVTGHAFPSALLASLHAQMRAFFALPLPRKRALERTDTNAWGYYDRELTKNVRDWKEVFDAGPAGGGNTPQWPNALPQFRATFESYTGACASLSFRLLAAITANLGMPADHLFAAFEPHHTSFLRLNHYPPCDEPAPPDAPTMPEHGHLGVHHHTDAGAITVLLQDDQAGLQVFRDDAWHTVMPRDDALVVNIGDVVQVWSNDHYKAALHRVVASGERSRYSAPYFFNPAYEADYAPLPSMCSRERPARYRPINWGAFRAARAAGDYADYGEEIQISWFGV